jgi:hypothetical protein
MLQKRDAWVKEHHQEYDVSYQQTDMEKEEHVEYQYREYHRNRMRELSEETNTTMRVTLYWEQQAWPTRAYIDKYEVGQWEPNSENTQVQNIAQV